MRGDIVRRYAWWLLVIVGCSTGSAASPSNGKTADAGTPLPHDSGAPADAGPDADADAHYPPVYGCPNGCPPGSTCVTPDNTIVGSCQARIPLDGGCYSCGVCGVPPQCEDGLVCRGQKCLPPLQQGEKGCAAENTRVCATGLYCLDDTCQGAGKLGETCECHEAVNSCADSLWCSMLTHKCEAPVFGNLGDPCDTRTRQCKEGLFCDVVSYACDAPPGVCKAKP